MKNNISQLEANFEVAVQEFTELAKVKLKEAQSLARQIDLIMKEVKNLSEQYGIPVNKNTLDSEFHVYGCYTPYSFTDKWNELVENDSDIIEDLEVLPGDPGYWQQSNY